jgi:peptidoglycan hydrolase-like protein with peptidoglycan-binding domain
MSGYPRDLASPDLWEASLNRSLARRDRRGRLHRRTSATTPASSTPARVAQPRRIDHDPLGLASRKRTTIARARARDLADGELWELSLGRSRARRRAAELRFVPTGSRARRLSVGTVAALAVGPASSLGEATAAPRTAGPAPPPPTTSEHHILLESGSTGYQVRRLQQELGVKVDGQFGPLTQAAVYEFQITHGLAVDGIVGPETSAALARRAPRKPLTKRAAVKLAQAALGVQVDGVFGPETEQAVRSLQAGAHIVVDGVVGPETWHALHVNGGVVLYPPPWALPHPKPRRSIAATTASGAHPGNSEGAPEGGSAEGSRGAGGEQDGAGAGPGEAPTNGRTPVAHTALQPGAPVQRRHPGGNPVRVLQEALGIQVDGEYGPETKAAVRHFQETHGLEVDGVVGPQTWGALGIEGAPIIYPPRPPQRHEASSSAGGESGGGGESSTGAEGIVARVIAAANEIATRPYVYGGGHGSFSSYGYDCSGSVSYALHGGGLLSSPEDSTELESYGEPGPGRYITIYANAEHAYMVVDGRRFDTVALAESGSRWSGSMGNDGGSFVERHPPGL